MKRHLLLLLIFMISLSAFSQIDPVAKNSLAIGGYDPVAYFKSAKATKGNEQILSTWKGANYHFLSQQNKLEFDSAPEKFLPQYNGYCALAVSYGKKISIDPETFKITDGKLYLFFHGESGGRKINSIDTWNKNELRLQKKADQLWPDVMKKEYKPGSTL